MSRTTNETTKGRAVGHTWRKNWLLGLVSGMVSLFGMPVLGQQSPNIVLIVADDLGFSDVGFNGCREIPTPNLDQLAATGVVFQAGYASHPYCSPSRAGLLTGRYQQRFGHECNPQAQNAFQSDQPQGLPLSETTLADALKREGYTTGAIGKWHLGDALKYWPQRRGFDEWFGFSAGGLSYWGELGRKDPRMGVHRGDQPVPRSELTYLTDDFSTEAVKFIDRHQDEPFFLYLAYNAPHAPDQAPRHHLEKTKHIEYGGRAVYGAMVAGMDEGIGRVIDQLEKCQIRDRTLVVFYSDNGGRTTHARNFPFRGHKGMLFEGGIRVPFLMSWPTVIPQGTREEAPITALDIFPTAMAAAGAKPSEKLDGLNLLPMLRDPRVPLPKRRLFWRYAMGAEEFGFAVRDGDWKLVESQFKQADLLFDLANDPWEQQNLADEQPETVQRLKQLIRQWDAGNVAPRWGDPHGVNVRQEEAERQRAVEAAARGERR